MRTVAGRGRDGDGVTLRLGLLGPGAAGRRHLANLAGRPDAEVVAVCEGRDAGEWERMLDGERLDAVLVCTPPLVHAGPSVAALERGVPVYLEKPLARTVDDGERIVAAWRRAGVVCAVGYQWRSLASLAGLRARLAGAAPAMLVSRGIGPAESHRAEPAWFDDPAQSGGVLFELASHDIDLQRAVAGPVTAVRASAGGRGCVAVLLDFASGATGAVSVAATRAGLRPTYTLDVLAPDATIRLDLADTGGVDPRATALGGFLDAVAAGAPNALACTPADALGTLRVLAAVERSIVTGAATGTGDA
jgi:predicted dehydrogenase